jgi:hypothetical protein
LIPTDTIAPLPSPSLSVLFRLSDAIKHYEETLAILMPQPRPPSSTYGPGGDYEEGDEEEDDDDEEEEDGAVENDLASYGDSESTSTHKTTYKTWASPQTKMMIVDRGLAVMVLNNLGLALQQQVYYYYYYLGSSTVRQEKCRNSCSIHKSAGKKRCSEIVRMYKVLWDSDGSIWGWESSDFPQLPQPPTRPPTHSSTH